MRSAFLMEIFNNSPLGRHYLPKETTKLIKKLYF